MTALVEDTKTSREMQQRAIAWMGTTVSALLFGTLVYFSSHRSDSYWLVTAVLGIGAPAAAAASSAIFLGELSRQGRAAMVRRTIEDWALNEPSLRVGRVQPISPIFGEQQFASMSGSTITAGYGVTIYYLAVLSMFGAGVAVGPLVATLTTWGAPEGLKIASQGVPHGLFTGSAIQILWAAITAVQALAVRRMGKKGVQLPVGS
ncbi:hypothetical protein [Arthrobacter dokdonensis]|uniref:hypothetical protein n=1 Tax=Arthrobacter dokdonellae TaxID=2211210 RepID=UPI001013CA8C|nr:hypothetical protein [Arthrobacter dokdonellae]